MQLRLSDGVLLMLSEMYCSCRCNCLNESNFLKLLSCRSRSELTDFFGGRKVSFVKFVPAPFVPTAHASSNSIVFSPSTGQFKMDKYRRVDRNSREEHTAASSNEIRVTQQGKIRNYMKYATNLLTVRLSFSIIEQISMNAFCRKMSRHHFI